METWVTVVITVSICAFLKFVFTHFFSSSSNGAKQYKLPPGPFALPLIGNPIWLFKPLTQLETILRQFHSKYGPIITIYFGNTPSIFIASHSASHHALVQNGAVFADRFPVMETAKLITSNQLNISTAFYGPTWRTLRRNLTSELLHPPRLKAHSPLRKWVLDILIDRLLDQSRSPISSGQLQGSTDQYGSVPVTLIDHIRFALFSLAAGMCFGEKFDASLIKKLHDSQRGVLLNIGKFNDLNFWPPKLGKFLFRKRWEEIYQLRKNQEDVLLPLIKARKAIVIQKESKSNSDKLAVIPYADTLFDLEIMDGEMRKRKLSEDELITLCSEFMDAITDTTVSSIQWVMANVVKYPEIQEKLFMEIKGVMGERETREVEEDDLQKMSYLKAVVMEGLRLHPPGHMLLPHKVMEDSVLEGGYKVPKGTMVNFMVADMGWDEKVWSDPMAFKPERFIMNNSDELDVDITGSKEIKMMPFGAGRRFCPGYALGLLHLEYFVSNLVWNFKLVAVGEVDLSEKQESATMMQYPLQAYLSPRRASLST